MYNNQMKMAFMEEGGLQDEGGTVDKESGNDVPSGSLKKEVRDDVPAMLSEGEFVFPADVVRFIGLNKLMEMRQQAKMGLQMMEKMGQMGNSEEAEIPDDLPFGVTDIVVMGNDDDEKEMAQGGVIKAAEGTLVERGIETMFSPAGTAVGLSPAAGILANATGADKRIYKALFDSTATFTGRDRGPVITGTASENKGKFYKNLASKSARFLLKLGVPLSVMMPDEMEDGTIPEELLDELKFTENKKAQGGVIYAQEGTDISKGVGAVRYDDGTIDNSAMMDAYNRIQPQQTDFEKAMGYGAGQGANPYMARRVPYTKEDGTIVNVLEDYAGRPMESIEGLTRVDPYQAGPVIGGDTPAGGGVDPVVPPTPPTPDDGSDEEARREAQKRDKRKEAREAKRKSEMEKMYNREATKLQMTPKEYKEKLFGTAAMDYKDAMSFKDRLALGKTDLENKAGQLKNVISGAKDELKEILKVDKTDEEKKKLADKRRKRRLLKDAKEGKGAFADRSKRFSKETKGYKGGRAKGGLMKKDYP